VPDAKVGVLDAKVGVLDAKVGLRTPKSSVGASSLSNRLLRGSLTPSVPLSQGERGKILAIPSPSPSGRGVGVRVPSLAPAKHALGDFKCVTYRGPTVEARV
jgi:hypothetical protein